MGVELRFVSPGSTYVKVSVNGSMIVPVIVTVFVPGVMTKLGSEGETVAVTLVIVSEAGAVALPVAVTESFTVKAGGVLSSNSVLSSSGKVNYFCSRACSICM